MPDPIADPPTPQPPAPAPPPPPPPTPQPAGDARDNLVMTLSTQLVEARRRAEELEAADRQRAAEAARAEQDRLAAQGNAEAARTALEKARADHDAALAAERGKLADVERRARVSFRDEKLAATLADKPLIPGAAAQLAKLFRDELDAHAEGDAYTVRTKDFVGVNDFVTRELARPEYAHFLRPDSQGGTGSTGTNRTAPPAAPVTPEERFTASLRTAVARNRSEAPGLDGTYGTAARLN